jgi:hypothetical protein
MALANALTYYASFVILTTKPSADYDRVTGLRKST